MPPTGPSLRVSCDNCRAKKLRCQPSSLSDPRAPCQRCLRSKSSTPCIFSPRSGTGGLAKASSISAEDASGTASKATGEKDSVFPGMSTFVLPGHGPGLPSPPSPAVARQRALSTTGQNPNENIEPIPMDLDNDVVADSTVEAGQSLIQQSLEDLWHDAFGEHVPNSNFFPGNDLDHNPVLDSLISGPDQVPGIANFNMDDESDIQEFLRMPSPSHAGLAMDTFQMKDQKPGATVDLAVLLAKMSQYEASLREKSVGELDDYPIGDALFLPARFCSILSEYGHTPPMEASSSSATSRQDPTKLLLTLSCYISLLRIYSSIFDYMGKHLLKMAEDHARNHIGQSSDAGMDASTGRRTMYSHHFHAPSADIHTYRDLRLSQLRTMCLCGAWDPVKKAASMLLASLGDVEEILQLPLAVRIIASASPGSDSSSSGDRSTSESAQEANRDDDVKGTVLFKEGLTNERLYTVVTKLASDVRDKVKVVKQLLQDLSKTHTSLLELEINT